MVLRYPIPDGSWKDFPLTANNPITIGRSPDADIVIEDEKASRQHCGIRFEDGAFLLRDLQSKNGTFLNGERMDSATLSAGDRFRIGSQIFRVEAEAGKGPETALQEVQDDMDGGKGYGTILREIVDDASGPKSPGRDES